MANNTEQNLLLLKDLDVYFSISPINKTPDAICILGATMPKMQETIDYTNMIYGKNILSDNLILLSGERCVTANVDASVDELQQIALLNNYDSYENLTETNLIQYLITNYGPGIKIINTFVVDILRGNLTRPTTQTTIIDFAKWLITNSSIQYITFVSNQPYIKYQEAIIKKTLKVVGLNICF